MGHTNYKAIAGIIKEIEIMRSSCGCSENGAKEFKKELKKKLADYFEREEREANTKETREFLKHSGLEEPFNRQQFKEWCG